MQLQMMLAVIALLLVGAHALPSHPRADDAAPKAHWSSAEFDLTERSDAAYSSGGKWFVDPPGTDYEERK
ncbi:hypothetical protein DACRYDRAFT_107224 [Dacryopinax primogenitus]|uniref:Uncharacterized protein n=1 Tax=Dacryopinax primogenitus (strain DJM 731) TaxID=1858805 RepID=M5G0M7_DACPD|nr:uncharacterized protein DACRYDRAFT_107224 [Dacryopinax primogenitus]EJU02294.1 hypothetical protein DACRYDRAFT_107224 [Dacryopinax primogenitus]